MEVMSKSLQSSTSEFIDKSIKTHGNKFDYSKVEYIGSHTKVCIICPEHGEFYQSPTNHLSGYGCLKCAWEYKRGKYRLTTSETFLLRLRKFMGINMIILKLNGKILTLQLQFYALFMGSLPKYPKI